MARERQAVVVIHGIGEQRPMNTLRGFVDSMITDEQGNKIPFYNRPDDLSDLFELRTFSVYPHRGSPRTDFFEYYWAYHMRGTKIMHIVAWLWRLMFRWITNVPGRIRWLYVVFWLMILVPAGAILTGYLDIQTLVTYKKWSFVGVGVYLLVNGAGFFLIRFLGDAARYTDASPENIEERQKIRANGLKLLKQLHQSGKYDRIIIVGHSLGSIIGYDLIKNLWVNYNQTHGKPDQVDQAKMEAFEKEYGLMDPSRHPKNFDATVYQKAQEEVRKEQNYLGNEWLISDFITLGSPLTYASLLLADDEKELKERIKERELPISPPIAERDKSLSYPLHYTSSAGHERTIRVFHHAGPFACTRWHNAYFKNDYVGGPLKEVLGPGINEFPIPVTGFGLGKLPFIPHTWYWGEPGKSHNKEAESIRWLRRIILPMYETKPRQENVEQ